MASRKWLVLIALALLLAIGLYFISQPEQRLNLIYFFHGVNDDSFRAKNLINDESMPLKLSLQLEKIKSLRNDLNSLNLDIKDPEDELFKKTELFLLTLELAEMKQDFYSSFFSLSEDINKGKRNLCDTNTLSELNEVLYSESDIAFQTTLIDLKDADYYLLTGKNLIDVNLNKEEEFEAGVSELQESINTYCLYYGIDENEE